MLTRMMVPGAWGSAASSASLRLEPGLIALAKQVRKPQRNALDEDATACCCQSKQAVSQRHRLFDRLPMGGPTSSVLLDAIMHLGIAECTCGCQEHDLEAAFPGARLSQTALARTHSAENQLLHACRSSTPSSRSRSM